MRLNRRTSATSTIIGLFCCMLPDATFTEIKICINVTSTGKYRIILLNCNVGTGILISSSHA